ncbi:transmembrane protein 256 homolog [Saccoglossus kowalevskii]|uniref:Transmembrane protein 256 homolog n=1 Tax=Saccoglossus kowalevskii TaxID=10224 RepID=A0ABM0H1R1_SACKO|nr:PREDICTED: transmembrane protein 256 homolog [Saccoglossus kowalevskii]
MLSTREIGMLFLRVGALSGATAVALGAYGAHAFKTNTQDEHKKHVFDTANRYHFLHSMVLLAVPLVRKPLIAGSLLSLGLLMFSGSCYVYAIHDVDSIRKVTPFGGTLLIAGWIAMAL